MIGIKEDENVDKGLGNFPEDKVLPELNNNIEEFKAEDEHDKKPEHYLQNLQAAEGIKIVNNVAENAAALTANMVPMDGEQNLIPNGIIENYDPNNTDNVENEIERNNDNVKVQQVAPVQEVQYVVPAQEVPRDQYVAPAREEEAAQQYVAQVPIQEISVDKYVVPAQEEAAAQYTLPIQEVATAHYVEPAQASSIIQDAAPLAVDNGFDDTHVEMGENLGENVEVPVVIQEPAVQPTKKIAVRFDNEGNSIDEDKHHEENCQVKEDSEEKVSTKKRKVKNQNLDGNDSETKTTPRVVVRFDSKGDSIDDDDTHHGENCEVKNSDEEKISTKKTKRRKSSHEHDEDQIDSENEASNYREDESSHESDEDDGIPVITIPLGDILRKYARMMEGNNSEYEEEETDERFVIRGYNDKKKDKNLIEL